ncbi:uncharacterized protein LOC127703793 [Mytilus californianus]|uniref:uncharacterized protein LOC127703793 n=1 Tax=Mytilus californianus TaxID=6549 RepID=UPI002246B1EA|nr:uncharacterized protein LOC127703793 [Mytilus californianus]
MCTSLKINGLWIYIFMLFASVDPKSSIWNLKSKPLVFGEDVQLSCDGSACQPNTIKKWIGGPSYKLLCYNGYSADSSKYAIMVNDTIADFGMMIKNIAVEDTSCRYTCACGLHQHTETLDLEGVDYIYPPDIHNITTMKRAGKYQIDIQLNVYPFPKCFLTYERNVIPVNIFKLPTKHSFREDYFQLYNVRIIYTLDMHSYICKGEILFTCNVGKRNYTLIRQSIDFCKDKMDNNDKYLIPLITIVAFASVVGLIYLIRYRYKRERGHPTDSGNNLLDPTTG